LSTRGESKFLDGVVVSAKMDKTVVVSVQRAFPHAAYKRIVRRSKKYKAHDGQNVGGEGDRVRIAACRPLSKDKRWRVVEVVEKAR